MGVADDPVPDAPISGLSHVQFRVADLGVSTRWYRAALGLVPMAEDHDLGYVALRHPGSGVVVVLTSVPGPPGGPGSVDHLAFAVPDRDALAEWAAHLMAVGINHAGPGGRTSVAPAPRPGRHRHRAGDGSSPGAGLTGTCGPSPGPST